MQTLSTTDQAALANQPRAQQCPGLTVFCENVCENIYVNCFRLNVLSCATFRFDCRPAEGSVLRPLQIRLKSSKQWWTQNVSSATKTSPTCWDLVYKCLFDQKQGYFSMVKPYLKSKPPCCRNIDFNPVWSRVSWNHRSAFYFSPDSFLCFCFSRDESTTRLHLKVSGLQLKQMWQSKCQQTRSTDLTHCECDGICSLVTPVCTHDRL